MANNNFAYIEKTLPKVIDKVFAQKSLTDKLMGSSDIKLDFVDNKTVKIFKLASTGFTDYKRGGHGESNTRGSAGSTLETFTLTQERYSEIPLDKLDTIEDGETVLGNLATEFYRVHAVQEVDAYRFSKLATVYTNETFGNRVVGAIADNTIISTFNKAFKWMEENKVSAENQLLYVSTDVMEKIRSTNELYRKLSQAEYKNGDVTFTIQTYEGRPIVEVPSDEFYTYCKTGKGFYPTANSKLINFLLVDKTCVIPVKRLDFAKVYNSMDENGSYLGFAGYLLTNLLNHDIFVTENKMAGVYAHISNTSATGVASGLLVNAVAGSATGQTVINSVVTRPAGILFDKVYLNTDATQKAVGDTITAGAKMLEVTFGVGVTVGTANNQVIATLDGKAVAVSKDFTTTLPKGA